MVVLLLVVASYSWPADIEVWSIIVQDRVPMASCCSVVDCCCKSKVNEVPVVGKFFECAEYMNE